MAKVFITEHTHSRVVQGQLVPVVQMPPLVSQTVNITAGSVQSSAFSAKTQLVAVHTDAICSVEFGTNPTATVNSRRLAANSTEYFQVDPAAKIAVITNT